MAFGLATFRGVYDVHSRFGAELPRSIEHPVDTKTLFLKRLSGLQDSFEIGLRLLFAEQHHADRKRDLSVDHVLRQQMLAQVSRDESVVARLAQKRSDPLEGVDETGEIAIGVTLANFVFREKNVVPRGQRAHRRRLNGSFEMKMQLSFR